MSKWILQEGLVTDEANFSALTSWSLGEGLFGEAFAITAINHSTIFAWPIGQLG